MLVKQATTKVMRTCLEEEAFAAKHRALQVADKELKRKKAWSTLELINHLKNYFLFVMYMDPLYTEAQLL